MVWRLRYVPRLGPDMAERKLCDIHAGDVDREIKGPRRISLHGRSRQPEQYDRYVEFGQPAPDRDEELCEQRRDVRHVCLSGRRFGTAHASQASRRQAFLEGPEPLPDNERASTGLDRGPSDRGRGSDWPIDGLVFRSMALQNGPSDI